MKIKITLIAFFASALILTSCMKNEVSPGIEAVRTAYAALLTAKAQAEITMANANAAFVNAQAQVKLSIAAINTAKADSLTEVADSLREELAHNMQIWALELDSLAAEMDLEIANLRQQIQDSTNATILAYWDKYLAALDSVRAAQIAISDKLEDMAILELALTSGDSTQAIADAEADLVDAQDALAVLQAELADATANLGNVNAITDRIAELKADTLSKNAERLLLLAQASEIKHDADVEADAVASASSKKAASAALTATAKTAVTTAKYNLSKADSIFATKYPVPDFWQTAIDSVDNALIALNVVYGDTAADCLRARTAQDTLDLGISDLLAAQGLAEDTIAMYQDSIDAYGADTLAAWNDYKAAVATWKVDTTAKGVLQRALTLATDSLIVWRQTMSDSTGIWVNTSDSTDLAAIINYTAADSTIKFYQIAIFTAVTIPGAVTDTVNMLADFGTSLGIFNTKVNSNPDFDGLMADQQVIWDNIEDVLIPAREGRVEYIATQIEDWVTECLHVKTYIEEALAFYENAVAYKESRRPDYETYMNEYWYAFLDSLQGVVTSKETALTTANTNYTNASTAYTNAVTAFDLANEPYTDLTTAASDLLDEIDILEEILIAYNTADDYNGGIVGAINALIVTAKADIVIAQHALDVKIAAFAAGEVDLDQYQIELDQLMAKLSAAQAQVTYWKALLEEAIAAAN